MPGEPERGSFGRQLARDSLLYAITWAEATSPAKYRPSPVGQAFSLTILRSFVGQAFACLSWSGLA